MGDSVKMAEQVKDASVDFVFIDADHHYESVLADIYAWTPKVRLGGWLGGHDLNEMGVRMAVQKVNFENLQIRAGSSIWLTQITN